MRGSGRPDGSADGTIFGDEAGLTGTTWQTQAGAADRSGSPETTAVDNAGEAMQLCGVQGGHTRLRLQARDALGVLERHASGNGVSRP